MKLMKKLSENKFYVYAYLDPRNHGDFQYGEYSFNYEPFYIGKGCGPRCNNLLNSRSFFLVNKIKKIQQEGFDVKVIKIFKGLPEHKAFSKEIDAINSIGRVSYKSGPLVNLCDGGEGPSGRILSEEHKKKISLFFKGRKRSKEECRRISERQVGNKNHFFGKHLTDAHKKKLSDALSGEKNHMFGRTRSVATKQKISKALTGKPSKNIGKKYPSKDPSTDKRCSLEMREKRSKAMAGEGNHMYGKKMTIGAKLKISIALTGRKITEEHKQKIGAAHLGSKRSESAKEKMRAAWKKRKPISEETRKKMSDAQKNRHSKKEKAIETIERKETSNG